MEEKDLQISIEMEINISKETTASGIDNYFTTYYVSKEQLIKLTPIYLIKNKVTSAESIDVFKYFTGISDDIFFIEEETKDDVYTATRLSTAEEIKMYEENASGSVVDNINEYKIKL